VKGEDGGGTAKNKKGDLPILRTSGQTTRSRAKGGGRKENETKKKKQTNGTRAVYKSNRGLNIRVGRRKGENEPLLLGQVRKSRADGAVKTEIDFTKREVSLGVRLGTGTHVNVPKMPKLEVFCALKSKQGIQELGGPCIEKFCSRSVCPV